MTDLTPPTPHIGRDEHRRTDPDETMRDATAAETDAYPFTIGDLSRSFDVTLRALRFYEERGLLEPKRRGQTRLYSRRDRARLSLILLGKRLGFSLKEISDMISLYDLPDGARRQMETAREKAAGQLVVLQNQRRDVDLAIAELQALTKEIDRRMAGMSPEG